MREGKMRHFAIHCSAIVCAVLLQALSFGTFSSAAEQNACTGDIARFCPEAKGYQTVMECLEAHEAQLSDACKDYEAKMERPRAESREPKMQQMRLREACREDAARLCSGTTSVTCLKDHADELSAPCGDAIRAAQGGEEKKSTK
jgi:hypothetical protein